MGRRALCWAVAVVALLGACASPFAEPPAQDDGALPGDLGRSASTGPDRSNDRSDGKGDDTRKPGGSEEPDKRSGPGKGEGPGDDDRNSPPPVAPGFTMIGAVEDPPGDVSAPAPGHADVVGVSIGDDGARAQVIVEFAGRLPAHTAQEEVQGLGVDLYRKSGDYQLFASGEPGGWFGYLYTPDGFVAYRGALQLGDRTLIFTVPWDAIGGRGSGEFGMFVDWTGPEDRYSQDMAPNSGRVPFSPPS